MTVHLEKARRQALSRPSVSTRHTLSRIWSVRFVSFSSVGLQGTTSAGTLPSAASGFGFQA